ncbi:MAG: xanthine dehydrogenase family protein molybdopterin-binding subunit [Alphaproteobacteria bacterium]
MTEAKIGQPFLRNEDQRLLTGQGRYTDDIPVPGAAHAVILRAPHAPAAIESIDVSPATALPGVIAVLTGADWQADNMNPMIHNAVPTGDGALGMTAADWSKVYLGLHYPLAAGEVRYVGDAVAMVIAETQSQARDAAEQVIVDYRALPSVTDTAEATDPSSPVVWDKAGANVCLDTVMGDVAATDAAFATAAHVVKRRYHIPRNSGVPLENRTVIGSWDEATGTYTVFGGAGGVVRHRNELAKMFKVDNDKVRVAVWDAGGNFGTRNRVYPEAPMVMWAARRLGRAVRHTTDRTETFLTDFQGRDLVTTLELALDNEGHFLAMRADNISNIGAYTISFTPLSKGSELITGPYAIPCATVRARGVFTNTVPTNPYRSAGRPEVIYALERIVDSAAAELGIDRLELRRRNLITLDLMPFANPLGLNYDSGDYPTCLDRALAMADCDGFAARRAESEARGLRRGLGIACYVESSLGAPLERSDITVAPEERVDVVVGTQSTGQGHETSFAQVAAECLGVPFESVRIRQGDTDFVLAGGGSHSGRSMRMAGNVIMMAADLVIERGRKLAGHVLEAATGDIDFADGRFTIRGTDRAIGLFELARAIEDRDDLPEELSGPLAEGTENVMHRPAFPYGTHICEVEIDPETGHVALERYTTVDDVGRVINPIIVDGQIHGGIAQGAGQALFEDYLWDPETGQPLAASLMDYTLPRADTMPSFNTATHIEPCTENPLGVRSGGEAGTTPAPGCITNGVVDALRDYGVDDVRMPTTPLRVWRAIQQGGSV